MALSKREKKFIKGIIRGQVKVLREFYTENNKKIYFYIKKRVNDHQLADQLTQDVFLVFIEKLRDFRGECSLKTYLYTIARYKVIDYFRKKKIKQILFSTLPKNVVEGLAIVLIDDQLRKKELADKIRRTLHHLPDKYRHILQLKYFKDEKVSDISSRLSMTFKATESLLFRARQAFIKVFSSSELSRIEKIT